MITIFIICIVVIVLIVILIAKANEEAPTRKPVVRNITPPGMVKIDKSSLEKYKTAIPRHIRIDYLKSHLNNGESQWCYFVNQEEYNQIIKNYETQQRNEQALFRCVELNNKGMAYEKSGDIDLAIETYEENIKGDHPALHSYDRLMILYRKRKDYLNELRIIDIALDVFNKDGIPFDTNQIREKYKQRKEKALALLMKETTNTACYDIEAPNRFRIFKDSVELIASTPKTSTFLLRVGDIENFFLWAKEQTAKGIQIELGKDIAELQKETYESININAIRIAEKEYTKWLAVDRTSEKKIDKATAKAFEALDELAKCIKTSSNYKQTLEQIEHFRTTIEQIYSEL